LYSIKKSGLFKENLGQAFSCKLPQKQRGKGVFLVKNREKKEKTFFKPIDGKKNM
jgi:hypothetical protein